MPTDAQTLAALFGGGNNITTGSADMNAFEKTLAANDLWRIASQPLLSAKFDTSTWNPMTSLGVTAGTAFLGGLLNKIGTQSEAEQIQKVNAILPQLYANPASVAAPEGVDLQAFGGLKGSVIEQQANTNEAVRRIVGEKGIQINPDGSWTVAQGAPNAINTIFNAEATAKEGAKAKNATGNRAMTGVASDLGKTLAAIESLNNAGEKISQFPGGKGVLGGVINWFAKQIPGTAPYQYQKDLPSLNDPLTQGLAGTSRMGTLAQTKEMLSQDFGQPESSMLQTIAENRQVMMDKAQKYLEVLAQAGWPEESAPSGLPSLKDLREKLSTVSTGEGLPNTNISTSLPDIGGMFNGEKVISIKKLR